MRVEMAPGWEDELDQPITDYLSTLAREVHADMVTTSPRATGRLMNDLDWEVQGLTARIGARTVDYAYYVEVGTRPHTENAPPGEGLDWPGAATPVNVVHHPGSVGTHWMRKSLYKARR